MCIRDRAEGHARARWQTRSMASAVTRARFRIRMPILCLTCGQCHNMGRALMPSSRTIFSKLCLH
eukprot:1014187-Pyramimonas_sp.AAC.1